MRDELERHTDRSVAQGAIYVTLMRLEKKGWLRSRLADPTPVRGGKSKRYFEITSEGMTGVQAARQEMDRLWEGLPQRQNAEAVPLSRHRPPLAARALLRLLLPGSIHESFAGDLEERFHRLAKSNPRAARRGYWTDVLSPTVRRFRSEARGMPLPPGTSPASGTGDGFVRPLLTDLKFAVWMRTPRLKHMESPHACLWTWARPSSQWTYPGSNRLRVRTGIVLRRPK